LGESRGKPPHLIPMTDDPFLTRSGVEVRLDTLRLTSTYAGHLEGTPAAISRRERERVSERVRKELPPGEPLVVLDSGGDELPRLRWVARLWSYRAFGPRADDSDYGSELFVCWYSDDLDGDLRARLEAVVRALDWETQAADVDLVG